MYDLSLRQWGSTTSQGKDLRDVAYSNYFPATFGINFGINANSKVEDYEHIQAISVGVGATYMLSLQKSSVESCPKKYQIFSAIRTWENARAANAFSRSIKKQLADPAKSWQLEPLDNNNWKLYPMMGGMRGRAINLTRDIKGGY